jgi:hypothetical protein
MQDKNAAGRGGMSTLDLLGGTAAVNRVVKLMLHKNRMTYQELCAAIDQLPPEKQMSREELGSALAELVDKDWITKTVEEGEDVYQVLLRPKASSTEQLHSDNLPRIDVAVDKNVNPGLQGSSAEKDGPGTKKNGFMDALRALFGGKK